MLNFFSKKNILLIFLFILLIFIFDLFQRNLNFNKINKDIENKLFEIKKEWEEAEKWKKKILKKRISSLKKWGKKKELKNNAFDFYSKNPELLYQIDREFVELSNEEKAGMVLMIGYDNQSNFNETKRIIEKYHIGGVIFLNKNPSRELLIGLEKNNKSNLKLLFSSDAENSLLKYRFLDFRKRKKIIDTSEIKNIEMAKKNADLISQMLYKKGFDINFAPVYDINKNQTIISNRSFSSENEIIQKLANAFMIQTQEDKIFATAKHFPGHGNVILDSHKELPTINGELIELNNFKSAIKNKVVFIMVGHLKIENNKEWNTDGLPATLSHKIMTNLLRDKMKFKGVVITDAMNMGAVSNFENVELRALEAGADIVLIPKNVELAYNDILSKMNSDPNFLKEVNKKVKKIIKLKILSDKNDKKA